MVLRTCASAEVAAGQFRGDSQLPSAALVTSFIAEEFTSNNLETHSAQISLP
jgi:hypothetical protein